MVEDMQKYKNERDNSGKKDTIFTRFLNYLKDSVIEIKKVVWPKRSDAIKMTVFVMFFVMVFALFIYGIDMVIAYLFNILLVKE